MVKPEGRGRGGAEGTFGGAPSRITLPEGRLPAGDERSDHKVELHSPEEQRDLVIVRSDPKARELLKNLDFPGPKWLFQKAVFLYVFNGPGLVFGLSIFADFTHPYDLGNPPQGLVQKPVHLFMSS